MSRSSSKTMRKRRRIKAKRARHLRPLKRDWRIKS